MVDDLIRGVTPPTGDSFLLKWYHPIQQPRASANFGLAIADELAATIVVDTSLGLGQEE